MAEYVGAIPVYLTDAATFHPNWLSLDPPHDEGGTTVYGEPVTPVVDTVYMVLTDGEYCRRLVTYNGEMYRLIGNVNITPTQKTLDFDGETVRYPVPAVSYYSQRGGNWNKWETILTITEDMRRIEFSIHEDNQGAGTSDNIEIRVGGVSVWSYGATTLHRWVDFTYVIKDEDVGKIVDIGAVGSSSYSVGWRVHSDSVCNVIMKMIDMESLEYVPNTSAENGQAGIIPAAMAGAYDKAFTSSGWDDVPLDITAEEIETIFNNATGTTTTYNGTEFIIGEFGGKTLYESRLPLSGISGNDLNSFDFAAHKMIDGRLSLPTRLIDLSISKSGDQWAVSPVVSLSADEKQNGILIIEYTKD